MTECDTSREKALAQFNDKDARNMAKAMATMFWHKHRAWGSREEFELAAMEGLWEAALRFDPSLASFRTFAYIHVRRSIQNVAHAAGFRISRANRGSKILPRPVSLDAACGRPGRIAFHLRDALACPEDNGADIPEDFWNRVGEHLDARSVQVLRYRFEDDFSLVKIGRKLGVCKERVRQIEEAALRTLAEQSKSGRYFGALA